MSPFEAVAAVGAHVRGRLVAVEQVAAQFARVGLPVGYARAAAALVEQAGRRRG